MANGVAMAADESYVVVSESGKFRLHKYVVETISSVCICSKINFLEFSSKSVRNYRKISL